MVTSSTCQTHFSAFQPGHIPNHDASTISCCVLCLAKANASKTRLLDRMSSMSIQSISKPTMNRLKERREAMHDVLRLLVMVSEVPPFSLYLECFPSGVMSETVYSGTFHLFSSDSWRVSMFVVMTCSRVSETASSNGDLCDALPSGLCATSLTPGCTVYWQL